MSGVGERTADHGSTGRRVVIEAAGWPRREQLRRAFEQAGYHAVTCAGPEGSDRRCLLAAGERCPAVEEADVVVHALGHYDPRNREVLERLGRVVPETPVVVEVPEPVVARHPERYQRVTVVPGPSGAEALVEAVRQVLGEP